MARQQSMKHGALIINPNEGRSVGTREPAASENIVRAEREDGQTRSPGSGGSDFGDSERGSGVRLCSEGGGEASLQRACGNDSSFSRVSLWERMRRR